MSSAPLEILSRLLVQAWEDVQQVWGEQLLWLLVPCAGDALALPSPR